MQDYLKNCYCLKHKQCIDPNKVKQWCLRWNCKHLRSLFKKRKNKRQKDKFLLEVKAEINIFISKDEDV